MSSPPTTVPQIYNALLTFGFSFLLLISLWLRYTRIMSVFPIENRRVLNLNIALLFCVSIEPFLFNIVRNVPAAVTNVTGYSNASTTLYALDLGAMFAILGGFTLTLASEEKKLIPKELMKQYRFEGVGSMVFALIFLISALPVFFTMQVNGQPLREYLWLAVLVLFSLSRNIRKRLFGTDMP